MREASNIVFGAIEPATITHPQSHTHLPKVVKSAKAFGLPDELFPFCEDNADDYCLKASGEVVFWSHNGATTEQWEDLASWIANVWVAENA